MAKETPSSPSSAALAAAPASAQRDAEAGQQGPEFIIHGRQEKDELCQSFSASHQGERQRSHWLWIHIHFYKHQTFMQPLRARQEARCCGICIKPRLCPLSTHPPERGQGQHTRSRQMGKESQKQPQGGARSPPKLPTAGWTRLCWEPGTNISSSPWGSQCSVQSNGRNANRHFGDSAVYTIIAVHMKHRNSTVEHWSWVFKA